MELSQLNVLDILKDVPNVLFDRDSEHAMNFELMAAALSSASSEENDLLKTVKRDDFKGLDEFEKKYLKLRKEAKETGFHRLEKALSENYWDSSGNRITGNSTARWPSDNMTDESIEFLKLTCNLKELEKSEGVDEMLKFQKSLKFKEHSKIKSNLSDTSDSSDESSPFDESDLLKDSEDSEFESLELEEEDMESNLLCEDTKDKAVELASDEDGDTDENPIEFGRPRISACLKFRFSDSKDDGKEKDYLIKNESLFLANPADYRISKKDNQEYHKQSEDPEKYKTMILARALRKYEEISKTIDYGMWKDFKPTNEDILKIYRKGISKEYLGVWEETLNEDDFREAAGVIAKTEKPNVSSSGDGGLKEQLKIDFKGLFQDIPERDESQGEGSGEGPKVPKSNAPAKGKPKPGGKGDSSKTNPSKKKSYKNKKKTWRVDEINFDF